MTFRFDYSLRSSEVASCVGVASYEAGWYRYSERQCTGRSQGMPLFVVTAAFTPHALEERTDDRAHGSCQEHVSC
jgi:hypothetical protein